MTAILGIKRDMTQCFDENGNVVPVTVVDINENVILKNIDSNETKNGVVIGIGKKKNPNKAEAGNYKQLGYVPQHIIEVEGENLEGGLPRKLDVEDLTGKKVHVTGTTKGKGFQGVVKRWNFAGGPKTHGQSDRHRAPGSIGSGTTPGRVYKGKKMGGRMGNETQTIKNLKIVKHLKEEGFILIKGGLPGNKGSKLFIKFI